MCNAWPVCASSSKHYPTFRMDVHDVTAYFMSRRVQLFALFSNGGKLLVKTSVIVFVFYMQNFVSSVVQLLQHAGYA